MSSRSGETALDGPTASVQTLGCKVNQFESEAVARHLVRAGYRLVGRGEPADLVVVNTCTVTHRADFESRALVRRAHRLNPAARVIVTGCYAQTRPEELKGLPGVVLVAGQNYKADLTGCLDMTDASHQGRVLVDPPGADRRILDLGFPDFDRTRAFFRIQDGCSARCAYCAVPEARGPSRSLEPKTVAAGLDAYADAGYQEIVLTGIHLGAYGLDLDPRTSLTGLIRGLPPQTGGSRLRLSSIEPNEVTDELVAMLASSPRLCPHLHLPLQSGSDRILARMRRPYTAGLFHRLVEAVKGLRPDLCLGADVLVGFPGEDEEAFGETRALVADLPISYLHVFPYSKRPGTPAAAMPEQVDPMKIKARVAALLETSREKRRAFYDHCLGQVRATLIESTMDRASGLHRGLTDNYIPVLIQGPPQAAGQIAPIRLGEPGPGGKVIGRPA
ncbi:MAG: tRNA (N(6)-L-threonylcarbamoyladenosine(37)-C(2))-methylthiotransferase MtaB [Proteobacteria bacterium]|nr:tRNA (N(6)-L-threonylcarbamoyladenosine(37)-C(2))-methylthiotransferase MtaB [Pseudomonadota bacterium]